MNITTTLIEVPCTCGVWFAIPQRMIDARREDGGTFYCPNGHKLSYGETALDKERKGAGRLAAQLDQEQAARRATERSLAAQKGATTRLKRRAVAGVCPCCNRTFKQLARHMASKHPEESASRDGHGTVA